MCARAFSLPDGFSLRLRPRQIVRAWEPGEGGGRGRGAERSGAVTSHPSSSRAGGEINLRETLCPAAPPHPAWRELGESRGCVGSNGSAALAAGPELPRGTGRPLPSGGARATAVDIGREFGMGCTYMCP